MQNTHQLLMIRPYAFGYNAETAIDNRFQHYPLDPKTIAQNALEEFDRFATLLEKEGLDLTILQDTAYPATPDSIFPNNWISFHEESCIYFYPLKSPNRRKERKPALLHQIHQRFPSETIRDWTKFEEDGLFLEGTGSMVLDRTERIAYACLSERTDETLFRKWCLEESYYPFSFQAQDPEGHLIYHTNVMMSIAEEYAVVCLECIQNVQKRALLIDQLHFTNKELVEISFQQVQQFAGNVLQVRGITGEKFLIMSTQAYQSFTPAQIKQLEVYNRIVHSPLHTIETYGGGGARCMLAEIFGTPRS